MGLELEWVAGQLHVKPRIVEALEADDFAQLPSPVFYRGYLRNYAKLVGEPEEEILREYRRATGGQSQSTTPRKVAFESGADIAATDLRMKFVTWSIIGATLGLSLFWGYSQIDWGKVQFPTGWTQRIESWLNPEQPAITQPQAAADGEEAVKPDPAQGASVAEINPAPGGVTQPPADGPLPAEEPVASVEKKSEPLKPTAAVPTPASHVTPAQPAQVAQPPSVAQPVAAGDPGKEIVLEMQGTSWIDIKDAGGSYRLFGERKAGERHVLGGKPPYQVVIGNVSVVTLKVHGKPYDFSTVKKGGMARITVGP